jgi:hypothetical protein
MESVEEVTHLVRHDEVAMEREYFGRGGHPTSVAFRVRSCGRQAASDLRT